MPTLMLQVEARAYRALERQQASATERGIWQPGEADWQPVRIQAGQQTVQARVRLDGGPADHGRASKWTLAVELEEDGALLDMDAFTLRSPTASGYLNGWLYAEALRRAGLHAPHHAFANVWMNGDDWGVYAVVERISPRSLAADRSSEGAIVRFDTPPFAAETGLPLLAKVESPDAGDPASDPAASRPSAAAWDLVRGLQEGRLSQEQAFDAEQVGRHLALADLWSATDVRGQGARRFYYAPTSAKLEPIADEVPSLEADRPFVSSLTATHDLAIAAAYVEEALRLSQPDYVDVLREDATQFERYRAALAEDVFPAYLEPPWPVLTDRQAQMWEALHPAQAVQAYWTDLQGESVTELHLANLLPYPVELLRLQIGDQQVKVLPEWVVEADWVALYERAKPAVILKGVQASTPAYVRLHIPSSVIAAPLSDVLRVTTRLVGAPDETTVDVQPDSYATRLESSRPTQPTVDQVLKQHPYLSRADQPGYLAIAPGTWQVRGDLILPDGVGLWASHPVTLTFERGAMLFTSGPLSLHGSEEGMVRLLPQEDEWAGVVVHHADGNAPSSLDRVDIRSTSGLRRDGERLPAGAVFYRSPLVMRRSRLWGSTAAAALYVRDAAFAITDTELRQALFDGFRGELAQGQMEGCAIHDALGNGISLSRSRLEVRDTALLRIQGAGVASASGSEVTATGIRSEDTGIAFAGTDSSLIRVQNARFAKAWHAVLATYLRDQAYGPSSIEASEILVEDDSTTAWSEEGNQVTVEGAPVPAGETPAFELPPRAGLPQTARVEHYRFGSALRLVGYDLPKRRVQSGSPLPFTLYWQSATKLGTDYTVFVHVLSSSGEIAAQWDAMPRQNAFPTTAWPVGEIVDDPHPVPLPEGMPAGSYRIALGVYDQRTAGRLAAMDPNGEAVPDGAVLLERTIEVE